MKQFRVFKISNTWSTEKLIKDVSFGVNNWGIPTAFITTSREVKL